MKIPILPFWLGLGSYLVLVSPLFFWADIPIDIKFYTNNPVVLQGEVRDFSLPVVAFALLISTSLGISGILFEILLSQQRNIKKLEESKEKLTSKLEEQEYQIEQLAFDDKKLKALGLEEFKS